MNEANGRVRPSAQQRRQILRRTRTVAMLGASPNPSRASNFVATYLLASTDYDVYFVNPNATEILDRPVYDSLAKLPVTRKSDLKALQAAMKPFGGLITVAPGQTMPAVTYKATSNGSVSDIDLDSIAKSLGSVYEHADAVGSLVMPEDDARRPTAWQKVPREWFPW